jgi:hypothetical protein
MWKTRAAGAAGLVASLGCLCSPRDQESVADTAAGVLDTGIAACEPADDPTLEIGTGDYGWSAWTDPEPLNFGPQGGQHIYFAFRETGLDLSDWSTVHLTTTPVVDPPVDQWAQLAFACEPNGTGQVLGLLVPVPLVHDELTFHAEVTDPLGTTIEAVVRACLDW